MTSAETYYEIGYSDALDGRSPNGELWHNISYRDGYYVGLEHR